MPINYTPTWPRKYDQPILNEYFDWLRDLHAKASAGQDVSGELASMRGVEAQMRLQGIADRHGSDLIRIVTESVRQ